MGFLSALSDIATAQIEQTIKEAVSPLPFYLRKLAFGTVIIVLSLFGLGLAFLFLAVALFFAVANYHTLAIASLWTSLLSGLIGASFLVIGIQLVRKPR